MGPKGCNTSSNTNHTTRNNIALPFFSQKDRKQSGF